MDIDTARGNAAQGNLIGNNEVFEVDEGGDNETGQEETQRQRNPH
jgi:hypothetical protein